MKAKMNPCNNYLKNKSGLYIVTLNNENPTSVNANDKRIASKCIHVNKSNCRFCKAKCLHRRKINYYKVFGKENTNYKPVVILEDISRAEKLILKELTIYRQRGPSGRLHEWLENITKEQLLDIIFLTIIKHSIPFEVINEK